MGEAFVVAVEEDADAEARGHAAYTEGDVAETDLESVEAIAIGELVGQGDEDDVEAGIEERSVEQDQSIFLLEDDED